VSAIATSRQRDRCDSDAGVPLLSRR